MKRRTTKLEERLISKGYYLSHKHYGGRKSEKTISYMYVNKNAFVKLDSKREKVVDYGLLNYSAMELTRMEWIGIDITLNMIKNDIYGESDIITPPSEYDEKKELPPMTPEQFDELCQEMENENGKVH